MAANQNQVISARVGKIFLGAAADDLGTYTLGTGGDISALLYSFTWNPAWTSEDVTALNAELEQMQKVIRRIAGSFTWKPTDAAIALAETLDNQDSSANFPIQVSPRGTASGKGFTAGGAEFENLSMNYQNKSLVSATLDYRFVAGPTTGTHP